MKREVCENCPVDMCRIYYYVNGYAPSGSKIDYVHVYSKKKYDEMERMNEIHDNYVCDRYVLKKGGRLYLRCAIYEDSLLSDFEWELDGCLPSNVESYDDCPCIMEHKIDAWNGKNEKNKKIAMTDLQSSKTDVYYGCNTETIAKRNRMTSRNKLKKQVNAYIYPSEMKHEPKDRLKRLNFFTSSERRYEKDEARKEINEAVEKYEKGEKD